MSDDLNKIELRSNEVQEILGHVPSRIIRYGITVILIVVGLLIMGSCFFTYPDILTAPVEVTTQNPPAILVARANGALSLIEVADSQKVTRGQLLAIIQNPANYKDLLQLQLLIDSTCADSVLNQPSEFLSLLKNNWQLGEVQDAYSSFVKELSQYQLFLSMDYNHQKINALSQKEVKLTEYIAIQEKQAALKNKEHDLNKTQFERDSTLFAREVIAKKDFENARKTLLQSEMDYESSRSAVINSKIQLQEIHQEIEDLKASQQTEMENYQSSLHELLTNLKAQLASWNDSYIFRSPIKGMVAFTKFRDVNQVVKSGDEVFTIIPENQGITIGRATISGAGVGKIKAGQRVNIKFDNFPYMEFGMIVGKVNKISMVPSGKDYVVEIALPAVLKTNYNRILPFSQQMPGTAEIVTENLPLIMRVINPLKSIYKKYKSNYKILPVIDSLHTGNNSDMLKMDTMPQTGNIEFEKTKTISDNNRIEYQIIGASFSSKPKAEKCQMEFIKKGYPAQVAETKGRFRVIIGFYTNKKLATQALDSIRNAEKDSTIWMMRFQ